MIGVWNGREVHFHQEDRGPEVLPAVYAIRNRESAVPKEGIELDRSEDQSAEIKCY